MRKRFRHGIHDDLLAFDTRLRLATRPSRLGEELNAAPAAALDYPVVIDDIQKAPELLDEVPRLIESRRLAVILCASSARKLKLSGDFEIMPPPMFLDLLHGAN